MSEFTWCPKLPDFTLLFAKPYSIQNWPTLWSIGPLHVSLGILMGNSWIVTVITWAMGANWLLRSCIYICGLQSLLLQCVSLLLLYICTVSDCFLLFVCINEYAPFTKWSLYTLLQIRVRNQNVPFLGLN